MKFDINLKNSINTNTHAEDVRTFSDGAAPALQSTGIERDGGVTNIYETPEAYAVAGDHFVTADGDDLQSVVSGDQRLISINGRQIGITSAYGVEKRLAISGCDDACITSTDTYLTATVKGSGIQVDEYSTAQVLLNTRTTTFTNLAAVLQFFTSLSIIRYQGIKFADSLEFALRLGPQVIILKEATPAQTLSTSIKNNGILGGTAIVSSIVYGGSLILAGTAGRVTSFDGSAWRYYNGTGKGTGPYNDGTATGAAIITCLSTFIEGGLEYLIVGARSGRLCSYANGTWNNYNKAGVGLWNNGAVVAADNIRSLCSFTSAAGVPYLAVGSEAGKMGSYTTAGGWVLYTAAAGLRNNATLLGATVIYSILHILSAGGESIVVISGGSVGNGRVGSMRFTGGAWNTKVYTDGSAADNPTNNNTVCGANPIFTAELWGSNGIIFASNAGTIGHWYAYAWYNYNGAGGAGVCINNQVVVGNQIIMDLVVFNSTLIVASLNGRVGSWDGTNWKNYDGTGAGTGLYVDAGAYLSGGTTHGMTVYQGKLIVTGANVAVTDTIVNSVTTANVYEPFYSDGAVQIGNLLETIGSASYLYVYRYENGHYLINLVGNSTGISYTLNNATLAINILQCSYAVPQIRLGKTRHLVSCIPQTAGGTQLYSLGYVGYNDFVTYSGTVAYQTNPRTTATAEQYALGFAYADVTFSVAASATDRWTYISQLSPTPSGLYMIYQSQNKAAGKESLINAYGKLTSGYGITPTKPFELRVGLINGIMSFLSAAVMDGINVDTMGALITNVGEFDATYMPDFKDDRILYRYNGVFYYTILSKTLTGNVFQKIGDQVYKINSISPLNIISMIDEKLHVGSSDYHGQMIFESTAAPAVTATNVAAVLGGAITGDPLAEGIFSNSIDVGDKLCYITTPTAANIQVFGYRIPYGWQSLEEMISVYIADLYAFSVANDGSELVLTDPSNPVYVPDDRLPVAIGFQYADGAVNTQSQTIFLNENYDGYVIGNEAKGVYSTFQLFGTRYLFDGYTIYQATFAGLVLSDIIAIAPAVGMQFISSTPTQAYFLSSFDNSIYIFNGGRSLSKFQRMSQMAAILRGIYSTRDNALLLETATSFIWVRDDIVTQNLKSAAQAGTLRLYDTTGGLVIGNDASTWRYGYAIINSSSVVVPLIWQSSYFGAASNQKSNITGFTARLYSPGKTAQLITGRVDMFDEKTHYSQTVQWDIKKTDYSSGGYYQIRTQPKTQKVLGTSLTLTIPAKSILVDVVAEYSDDANAITAGKATR